MNGVSCFVAGEGCLVASCLKVLVAQGCDVLGVASADRSVQAWAETEGISSIVDRSTFEKQLLSSEYDYLFSIENIQWSVPAAVISRARKATINYHESPVPQQTGLLATAWALLNNQTQHALTWHEVVLASDAERIFQQKVTHSISGSSVRIGDILPVFDRSLIPAISEQNAGICQQERAVAARSSELSPFEHPYLALKTTSQQQTARQHDPIVLEQKVAAKSLLSIFAAYCARLSPDPEFDLGLQIESQNPSTGIFACQMPMRVQIQDGDSFSQFQARLEASLEETQRLESFDYRLLQPAAPQHTLPVAIVRLSSPDRLVGAQLDGAMNLVAYEDGSTPELIHTGSLTAVDSQAIVCQLQNLIPACLEQPERLLAELPLLSPVERQQLLVEWNQTATPVPTDVCIHELFQQQVARTPDAIAVAFDSERLTYQELNARANQLAHYLICQGVKPDTLVGLEMERSIEMVVGLLAIHKAGGAYLPLDPDFPADRLALMLADSQAAIILTQQQLIPKLAISATVRAVAIDSSWGEIAQQPTTNPQTEVNPANLAYIIYTSGSTGKPKGVMVEHRNAVNFSIGMDARIDCQPGVWLAVTSLSFDISVLEIFWTLTRGFKVVIYNAKAERPRSISSDLTIVPDNSIAALIDRHRVTHLQCTPSMASLLIADPNTCQALSRIQTMMVGGEALTEALALELQRIMPGQIHNMYGPTETTIWSTTHLLTEVEGVVPLGRPIANTQLYILDKLQQPVPVGIAGELLIGGKGVTRGYLNRPDLTQERFIPNPFVGVGDSLPLGTASVPENLDDTARLYRTGDLVRYRNDGNLEFLGRLDFQVKIRGYRIELGEIETILSRHEAIREAAIVVREDEPGDKRLVAYFISQPGQQPTTAILRAHLRAQLPEYMVPANFVQLPAFPLTPNHKIDRQAFPAPLLAPAPPAPAPTIAPQQSIDQKLLKIWQQVLQTSEIDPTDNFFNLGGDSLVAVTLIEKIRSVFNVNLPLISLFQSPTILTLTKEIEEFQP